MSNRPHEAEIEQGMFNMLWWLAWADRQEQLRTEGFDVASLSGCAIEEVAPEPTERQRDFLCAVRAKLRQGLQKMNHARLSTLYLRALAANGGATKSGRKDSPERFGECLVFMGLGHGVSWFDDNETFPLLVPHIDHYADDLFTYDFDVNETLEAYYKRRRHAHREAEAQRLIEFLNDEGLAERLHNWLLQIEE